MLFQTLLTILSVVVVYAAPVAKGAGRKIPLVRSTLPVDGPSTYLQGLARHGSRDALSRRSKGTADISAGFTPSGGEYQAPLTIGNQEFQVIFDTGSPDLWVYSVETTDAPSGVPLYDPLTSSTAVHTNGTFNISYADGSDSYGDVYLDTINLGGLVIKDQAVESPTYVSGNFLKTGSDGILGLSLGSNTILPAGFPTTLQNLADSGELESLLFTSALTRSGEFQSFYTFGYIDEDLLAGQTPTYVPIIPGSRWWEFPSEYAIVNGQKYSRKGNTAIADTGTTMIFLGASLVRAIYEPMGGVYDPTVPGWLIPSDISVDQLTNVTLVAGNAEIFLQPLDLAFLPVNDTWVLGSIQETDKPGQPEVFGQYWLTNTYSIWDFGSTSAGIQFGVVQRLPSY